MTELTRIVPDKGVRTVYNGTGGTLSQGTLVSLKAAATIKWEIEAEATNDGNAYGVLMNDVADASYGEAQIAGVALCLAGGTIAIGALVMPDTGGKVVTCTAGNTVVGTAITAGTASALCEVELASGLSGEMPG